MAQQVDGSHELAWIRSVVVRHVRIQEGNVWVLLYVDDVIVMARELPDVERVKKELSEQLEIKDMKDLNTFLGVNFIRDEGGAWLSQSHYCTEVLRRFDMSAYKAVKTPDSTSSEIDASYSILDDISKYQELVGSLLFLATCTRPDIALAVNLLTRHCASPNINDMIAAKRLLRYLKGTEGFALRLENSPPEILSAFSDADWAGDRTDRKSTAGIFLQLGETSIVWKSSKQSGTALSSTEAVQIALSESCKEII